MQHSDETTQPSIPWRLIAQSGVRSFEWSDRGVRMFYTIRGSEQDFNRKFQPRFLKQLHSNTIVDADDFTTTMGDGLISHSAQCMIGIKVADCLPVYLYNDKKICVIHSGWQGIIKGIVKKATEIMGAYSFVLGASIGSCCYEIKEDVAHHFRKSYECALSMRDSRIFLDLKKAVIADLGQEHLTGSLEYCTKCESRFFYSYRRGDKEMRNFATIVREVQQ